MRSGSEGRLMLGAIYRISRVGIDGGLQLTDPASGPYVDGYGWLPERFRPIYRPKSELIEGLLKPADAPAEREPIRA
jgi:hypothetical protein